MPFEIYHSPGATAPPSFVIYGVKDSGDLTVEINPSSPAPTLNYLHDADKERWILVIEGMQSDVNPYVFKFLINSVEVDTKSIIISAAPPNVEFLTAEHPPACPNYPNCTGVKGKHIVAWGKSSAALTMKRIITVAPIPNAIEGTDVPTGGSILYVVQFPEITEDLPTEAVLHLKNGTPADNITRPIRVIA